MMNIETKPRVLHFICSTGFYGAEKWVLALANNVGREEVDSELAVTSEPENKNLELTTAFRNLELPAHEIDMSGRFDLRVVRNLVGIIKERRINILHSHGYKSDIIGVIAAKLSGIKCITTPHGFENTDDWKLSVFIRLGCQTFRFFDYVVPLSKELVKDVKNIGVSDEKISYIRNGVDLTSIKFRLPSKFRKTRKASDNSHTIGFIGQLISRKNLYDLFDVFEMVAQDKPELKLVLLGDGDSRESYETYASQLNCSSQINFEGFCSDPLDYLANFDLFVMTSTLEGIPRCLMESMAMGVPVAAYDIPGVDQLITDGKTGFLAPLGNKELLARYWETLLWDVAIADEISQKAAEHIEEKFSARRMAIEYTALYRSLLDTTF